MSANDLPPLDPAVAAKMPAAMVADYNRRRDAALATPRERNRPNAYAEVRAQLAQTLEALPEHPNVPPERTPEGERQTRYRLAMGENFEFSAPIDRKRIRNPAAFDKLAGWDGKFPGPIATGPTGMCKTRAAFAALERLFVKENRAFTWFPVKRLLAEFARYEKRDILDEFYRMHSHSAVLLVDDVDKINWQFDSEPGVLFQFYDWVYRQRRPTITTTNRSREWWAEHAGEAFVRRLFDEAHREVRF